MDTQQIKADYDRDGFVALPGFVSGHALTAIEENLQRFIQDRVPTLPREHAFYEDKDNPDTLKQLQNLQEYDPFFGALMADGSFHALAECVLGGPVVAENLQYFNKPPRIGKPTPPHQDGYYFMLDPCEAVTMWFALDDVDEENGCVHYVRGSHKDGMQPHGRTDTLGFSQGLTDTSCCDVKDCDVACPAQPGDLLAHDSLTIHWASGNDSPTRTRRALGFVYFSEAARVDEEAHEAYRKKLREDMLKSGKI